MTVTVKLEASLEERLRRRAAASGRSTSDVIRAALQSYLDAPEKALARSAFDLGSNLFGRHQGPRELASGRKEALADLWASRQSRRGG